MNASVLEKALKMLEDKTIDGMEKARQYLLAEYIAATAQEPKRAKSFTTAIKKFFSLTSPTYTEMHKKLLTIQHRGKDNAPFVCNGNSLAIFCEDFPELSAFEHTHRANSLDIDRILQQAPTGTERALTESESVLISNLAKYEKICKANGEESKHIFIFGKTFATKQLRALVDMIGTPSEYITDESKPYTGALFTTERATAFILPCKITPEILEKVRERSQRIAETIKQK